MNMKSRVQGKRIARRVNSYLMLGAAAAALLSPATGFAQDNGTDQTSQAPQQADENKPIIVTGSRVPRIGFDIVPRQHQWHGFEVVI